jgi:hypothetical protein
VGETMNSKIIAGLLILSWLVLCSPGPPNAHAAGVPNALPSAINPAADYLFFFHNYYVETKGSDGDCRYADILKSFSDRGFIVISEIRAKDAPIAGYEEKAAAEIRKLLEAGVPQKNITVAGHSKGGVISIGIASLLGKPQINYLILAGCGIKGLEKAYPDPGRLKGNFLSLYATSDKIAGSCRTTFPQPGKDFTVEEIPLESTAGHQLFFRPGDLWVEPAAAWLKRGR